MTGTTGDAWNDPTKGGELARSQFDRGADVVYAAAGGTGLGVYQAAKDAGKLAIGVDSNQNYIHPGTMLTSMLKRVDLAVYNAFKTAQDGTWKPGLQVLGLAEDGVGWALDDNNKPLITADMKAKVEAAKEDIVSRQDQGARLHGRQRLPVAAGHAVIALSSRRGGRSDPPLRRRAAPAVELIGIDKRFGAVHANRDVTVTIARGSIHGIVGENGAGKSTLMSILYGYYQADAGEIRVGGRPCRIRSSARRHRRRHRHGASAFHAGGRFHACWRTSCWASRAAPLLRDGMAKARAALTATCSRYLRPRGRSRRASSTICPVGLQQRVEILKALYRGAEILILDEPTGVLTPQEADQLFVMLTPLPRAGQDGDPDHPQAAGDHGRHRPRHRHAQRRGGGYRRHRRPPAASSWPR